MNDVPPEAAEGPVVDRLSAEGLVARDVAAETMPPPSEDGEGAPNVWSDEAAESAFRAEARARGETVTASPTAVDLAEEKDPKALPPLADLVKRLSPEIRETLDDLFRAKFTTVKRLPKKVFKPGAN